jgi:LysR family transcriptional regulator for metE and metH
MILDVRHLELVEAIVGEGTLTRAAERLYLTQPALSHQLRQVEERLGVELFARSGRGLVLSPAGERVLRASRVVLQELRRAEADVKALAAGRAGTLRIAAECFTTYHWLPEVLRGFAAEWPGVEVQVRIEASGDPVDHLARRELDVALVACASESAPSLALTPLFDDEVVMLVSAAHPWAGRAHVDAADFRGEHLLVHREGAQDSLHRRVLVPAGVEPARTTVLPMSTEATVAMVRAGIGVAPLAQWAARPYLGAGDLAAVRVTAGGLHRTWSAATRDEAHPPYVDAFLAHLRRADIGTAEPGASVATVPADVAAV